MQELPATRDTLLLKLRTHNQDAWAEFLLIYEQAIYGYCRRRGLQDADARDVTQDVLAAVDQRIGTPWQTDRSMGTFRGWLFRVARNRAVDRYQEIARRASGPGDSQIARELAQHVDEAEESAALWTEYRRVLMDRAAQKVRPMVRESSWQAFWRTAVEGHPPGQVAKDLGMSVGTVYTAKCRVLARIKDVVARFDAENEVEIEPTEGA